MSVLAGAPDALLCRRPCRREMQSVPSAMRLPGQVPVEPLQHRPDHRALVPAPCDDLSADRLSGSPHPLTHHRCLMVPGPALQEMNAVYADTDLGMIAQVDELVVWLYLA